MTKEHEPDVSFAAAIAYDGEKDRAPRITAKGKGVIAEKIISCAVKNGIPIRKDPSLVEILSRLHIDEEIPPELYHAVARIFAFLYRINEEHREFSSLS
ncbi:MAG: EscU/YscU/HrcU family type III secretion system export apparatus switch protein [Syntrophales bacterium]|jgi:flagellar biosynthesis protein|nr:EscU/YscU/HrcU family type III secretion system export apparatus switch protein [Syntrophales bacterium]MDY0043339.1 EscU/YscU/HrcU family type III secretion system export apparatus switch protein [Syntrophales bacterium]